MELMMIDQHGWTKSVKIEKAITRVGSAAGNDIQLHSKKIAPVHLQFIYSPELPASCKLVNLATEIVVRGNDDEYQLPRLGTIEIRDGDEIELGEFRLGLKIPLIAEYLQRSSVIDASLSFQDAVMRSEMATVGQLTVKNIGQQTDCQFKVVLSGLPEDCYQVDPIPLMYPDAQEDVRVQLFHQKHYPQVGFHDLYFSITAPANYPGEEMIIKQGIYVVPVFDQRLELIDDVVSPSRVDEGIGAPSEPVEETPSAALETSVAIETSVAPEPVKPQPELAFQEVPRDEIPAEPFIADEDVPTGPEVQEPTEIVEPPSTSEAPEPVLPEPVVEFKEVPRTDAPKEEGIPETEPQPEPARREPDTDVDTAFDQAS